MKDSNRGTGFAYTDRIQPVDASRSTTLAANTPDYAAGEVHPDDLPDNLPTAGGNHSRSKPESKSQTESKNSTPVKPLAKSFGQRIGELVASGEHFAIDDGDKLYRYVNGHYVTRADQFIKDRAKSITAGGIMRASWSTTNAENVVGWIAADAPDLEPPVPEYLNLNNGVLRLKDRKLLPHDHKYRTTVQLPIAFDREAACPAIDECIRVTERFKCSH